MAGNTKKKRAHKVSQGIHGATKHPLTEVGKALLGKGLVQSLSHVPVHRNWSGTFVVNQPFDPEQAAIYEEAERKKRGDE